ncbi:MAG: AAA family ATPase [Actinobacteria bacterium]|nr:AAA family ATPase [Actinomycetota bacterium]
MASCPACGQDNPEIARFCLACGQPLAVAERATREERRVVSVVFVDLVGFTAQSESLDPEDVQAILAPYHELVRTEFESFGGVVEKFIGDAIVAVFGAPTAYGDDAERAVRAALAVRNAALETDKRQLHLDLQLRIAVNTGEAIVQLGSRPELGEAMVAGDVVNTAQRLQAAAPVNGVLVGNETRAATRDAIQYEAASAVLAKGKAAPVKAWLAVRSLLDAGERRHRGDLVGRARELDVLRGIWERVSGDRTPHLVTVIGPAGIGKTRLTQEFDRVVNELGGRSVHGRCLPYRESSAYFAFSTQVKQLCGVFESDPPEVGLRKLRESAEPDVAEHLAILLGLDPDGVVQDRETLFFSVRRFIESVATERPTMLVFEDIHWADRGLLDLIELLAARLRDLPIMLLALARPDLLDARPSWGGGLTAYTALPLSPLAAHDAEELAEKLLGTPQGDRASRLAATAEGNPLFIEQLAATMAETHEESLPTTIRGIVAARLDALPAAERTLLLDAAVIGKMFWRGAVERMTGERTDANLLGALERRDLIVRDTSSIIEGEQQFSFKHVLIREVAYELIPRAQRKALHARVAEFFEDSTSELGESAAALARHWRAAGEPERAFGYFVRAAEQAENGWAKDKAALLYREALELVPADDSERMASLRRRLALARAAAVHIPDARQLIRESPRE